MWLDENGRIDFKRYAYFISVGLIIVVALYDINRSIVTASMLPMTSVTVIIAYIVIHTVEFLVKYFIDEWK